MMWSPVTWCYAIRCCQPLALSRGELQGSAVHTAGPKNYPVVQFTTLHSSRLMGVSGKDNDKIHACAQVQLAYMDVCLGSLLCAVILMYAVLLFLTWV